MNFWSYYWLVWFFAGFAAPEFYWIARNPMFTVSDETWGFLNVDLGHPLDFHEWTPLHWAFGVVFIIFMSWLFVHLMFGYLR